MTFHSVLSVRLAKQAVFNGFDGTLVRMPYGTRCRCGIVLCDSVNTRAYIRPHMHTAHTWNGRRRNGSVCACVSACVFPDSGTM